MKLTFILLTAAIVNVSAKGLSQTVSFHGTNVPLQEVFSVIEQQTGFKVAYNKPLLDKAHPVSLNVTDIPLTDFLRQVFYDQPLTYSIKSKAIVIFGKASLSSASDLGSPAQVLMPPGNVQGRVINEEGEALAGANVMVKGTSLGASTDASGHFKIENIAAGEYILIVSFVGYATKTSSIKVPESGTAAFDIKLSPSLVNLDQMTVTGTLSKRAIRAYPATIAVINQDELKNRNLNNIANVLESVPGVIIQPGSETANSQNVRQPNQILIRGVDGTATGIKYIVDGVEIVSVGGGTTQSILQTLNPNDIDKIEILKGPMASTLYGSGAAGGVISITTKKGKAGKTRFNLKTMFTQRANEYADYNGYSQDYAMSLSGGNESFNYLLSSEYNLYPTTKLSDVNNGIDDKTWSYTTKVSGKVNNVSADLSLHYGTEKSGSSSTTASFNKFMESIGLPPTADYPLDDIRNYQRNFLSSIHLKHTILNNWYHDLTVGYSLMNSSRINFTQSPYSGNYESNGENLYSKINARYFMFYDHSWSSAIKSSLTAGFEYNGYEQRYLTLSTTTPILNFFSASTPATEAAAFFTKSPYSSTGYFAEMVTGFRNNLFLTTGIRFDKNSGYGANVGAYAQPRVGLSYVIDANVFKIKPRVIWGVSSTPPEPAFKLASTVYQSYGTYITIANPDLKPQRSQGYEFGADIFYGTNYSLNFTYYNQKIKDLIQNTTTLDFSTNPYTATFYYFNIADAINKGVEVSAKAIFDPFTIALSYTQTTSKWGDKVGQDLTPIVYPGAPSTQVPKKSLYTRLSYSVPSFLKWTKKGGSINLDWRYNGSAFNVDGIAYALATAAWQQDPSGPYPDYNSYFIWQKGYGIFNLRADYSVTNFGALYVDIQNLVNRQGNITGNLFSPFPGRRINFGFNLNF